MSNLYAVKFYVTISILLSATFVPSVLWGAEPNLQRLSEANHRDLLAVTSDQEAMTLFRKKIQPQAKLSRSHVRRPARSSSTPVTTQDSIEKTVAFVGSLLAARLAYTIQTTAQRDDLAGFQEFLAQSAAARQWIMTKPLTDVVTRMLSVTKAFSDHVKTITPLTQRPRDFDAFATYLDDRYPQLTHTPTSWVSLLERGALTELSDRLMEYWNEDRSEGQSAHHLVGNDHEAQSRYGQYFSETRLLPVFKSHVIALAIHAHAESLQKARSALRNLEQSHRSHTVTHNVGRLCGKWQWTVHNHQNHGDHKMTMSFGNAAKKPNAQPQPEDIQIHGDTVYLRWKFPKGLQEDSLLLSNHDQRLEGTFKNSFGPYGSISGKRLTSCKKR